MERYGWHVILKDRKLRYNDGRKVNVGSRLKFKRKPLVVEREPILCIQGMHASAEIEDAIACFRQALNDVDVPEGAWLCRVLVEGTDYKGRSRKKTEWGMPKFVGTHRTVLGMIPLAEYSRMSWQHTKRAAAALVKLRMEARNRKNRNSMAGIKLK